MCGGAWFEAAAAVQRASGDRDAVRIGERRIEIAVILVLGAVADGLLGSLLPSRHQPGGAVGVSSSGRGFRGQWFG